MRVAYVVLAVVGAVSSNYLDTMMDGLTIRCWMNRDCQPYDSPKDYSLLYSNVHLGVTIRVGYRMCPYLRSRFSHKAKIGPCPPVVESCIRA